MHRRLALGKRRGYRRRSGHHSALRLWLGSTNRGPAAGRQGMAKLPLSIAVGDYDRVRPLVDGSVAIDGVAPNFMLLEPEGIFFRAFGDADFDICGRWLRTSAAKT